MEQRSFRQPYWMPLENFQAAKILFFDDEGKPFDIFGETLSHHGYEIETVKAENDLSTCALKGGYTAILIRCRCAKGHILNQIASFAHEKNCPPVIIISEDVGVMAHIEALRAGASSYILVPCDKLEVIDRLEALSVNNVNEKNFNVLVVEESLTALLDHEAMLKERGFNVRKLNQWQHILEDISHFLPDLILIDDKLNDGNGGEIAAAVRMNPAHDSIPIVFLSDSNDQAHHNDLVVRGGDEVLMRSASPHQLCLTIETRILRFLRIRAGMTQDSLTGLLNHKNIKYALNAEISRARRSGNSLSFCMLDLDHFKMVNDNYGHLKGDQVIKALAGFLVNRLRISDFVGRYGGEEFGIILPNTPVENAANLMNQIREAFSLLNFDDNEESFSVSFSMGIASSHDHQSVESLIAAADKALYHAKKMGRNRLYTSSQVE